MVKEMNEQPYIYVTKSITERFYNPVYGDDRLCECGDVYFRHFNSYEDPPFPSGCKYCDCFEFKEKIDKIGIEK